MTMTAIIIIIFHDGNERESEFSQTSVEDFAESHDLRFREGYIAGFTSRRGESTAKQILLEITFEELKLYASVRQNKNDW